MVSGMLTAIRDFVRDSFKVLGGRDARRLQVGELSVWIEQGPHAILAAVVRGNAPPELRVTLQEALEHVHAQLGEALEAFDGDAAPFEGVRPVLEALPAGAISSRTKKASLGAAGGGRRRWSSRCAGVGGLRADRAGRAGTPTSTALRAEPGVVVVSAERRRRQGFVVSGLRDPLARDPASLLASAGLAPADVTRQLGAVSGARPGAGRRARAAAAARRPTASTLRLADGVLRRPERRRRRVDRRQLQRLAPLIPGVDPLRCRAGCSTAEVRRLSRAARRRRRCCSSGLDDVRRRAASRSSRRRSSASARSTRSRRRSAPVHDRDRRPRRCDGPPTTNDAAQPSRADAVCAAVLAARVRIDAT